MGRAKRLTWWCNYAQASAALLRGLDFVFDPDLVNDPNVAYSILATGMITGGIFANTRTLSQYFDASHTDYVKARDMVNSAVSLSEKKEVAGLAELFERILLAAKPGQQRVVRQ